MSSEIADTIIIGAGVVGLAIARRLARSGHEVLVLEANDSFGMEISSRNSGVIHAGIYYPPGTLKSRSCIRGKQLLYDYCEQRQVPHQCCGKLIIATREDEHDQLKALQDNALRAGLADLKWLDKSGVRTLEPDIRASAAVLSPSTGIIDVHELMLALLADLEASGGSLVTNSRVLGGTPGNDCIELKINDGDEYTVAAKTVVNTAGHGARTVAQGFAAVENRHVPVIYPIRGHYYEYAGKLPFSRLVYPVPGLTGLGIHVTHDLAGQFRFGPDSEYCQTLDYHFDESGKSLFARAIRNWYPQLDESRLQPGYVGIRPSLQSHGEASRDFVVSGPGDHGVTGLVNLFGIDSPGLTACMALAEEVEASLRNG
jgi:L-2-hydroxyglutarate oxidase LhgO